MAVAVAQRHVPRLVSERRIPYIKWGHLIRFDPDEIATWIGRQPPPHLSSRVSVHLSGWASPVALGAMTDVRWSPRGAPR
jgi:hypothetical protein